MYKNLKNKSDGFTIIEVLIVLAIAGLIMVIVFLAVPALQRNNRNTQRNNDASRVAGAINECVGNNNGNLTLCDTTGEISPNYINLANNQQLLTWGTAGLNSFAVATGSQCVNNVVSAGGGSRSFAISWLVETSNGTAPRCVGS